MKQFKQFHILEHTFDPQTMKGKFSYTFDDEVNFTEIIDFGNNLEFKIQNLELKILDNLLFHLSIALGISYYKLSPTANIKLQNGTLNEDQIFFWKQFYINGLGEFFFTNNLKPFAPEFISNCSPCEGRGTSHSEVVGLFSSSTNKALVPLGGGKDSLVSVELIKKLGISFNTCTFGKDKPLYTQVNDIIHTPRLFISRELDPLLFAMNKEGYYNGHVPISGIIAFVLVTAAYLYDYKYIVMSNEKSANEGNTEIDGMVINHQRSKSLEFEKAFDTYVQKYLSPDLKYFSILRGMYEIKIAKEFAQHPQYFSAFSSCNRNFHILSPLSSVPQSGAKGDAEPMAKQGDLSPHSELWCNHCPKCAFVYSILRPRITHKQTLQIFGKELYEDASLEQLFKELLGISGIKPFECVGTNEEVILAMRKYRINSANREPRTATPYIMKIFESEILPKMTESDLQKLEEKLMRIYPENNIPPEITF